MQVGSLIVLLVPLMVTAAWSKYSAFGFPCEVKNSLVKIAS